VCRDEVKLVYQFATHCHLASFAGAACIGVRRQAQRDIALHAARRRGAFKSHAELAWVNVCSRLEAANMTVANLVKVTTYLSSREYAVQNREVRQAVLGAPRERSG